MRYADRRLLYVLTLLPTTTANDSFITYLARFSIVDVCFWTQNVSAAFESHTATFCFQYGFFINVLSNYSYKTCHF